MRSLAAITAVLAALTATAPATGVAAAWVGTPVLTPVVTPDTTVTGTGTVGGGQTVVHEKVTDPGSGKSGHDDDASARPLVTYSVHWSTVPDPSHPGFDGA